MRGNIANMVITHANSLSIGSGVCGFWHHRLSWSLLQQWKHSRDGSRLACIDPEDSEVKRSKVTGQGHTVMITVVMLGSELLLWIWWWAVCCGCRWEMWWEVKRLSSKPLSPWLRVSTLHLPRDWIPVSLYSRLPRQPLPILYVTSVSSHCTQSTTLLSFVASF